MIITDNLKKINKNEKKLLILGDFDGVHKGHVSLIEKSVKNAKAEKETVTTIAMIRPIPRIFEITFISFFPQYWEARIVIAELSPKNMTFIRNISCPARPEADSDVWSTFPSMSVSATDTEDAIRFCTTMGITRTNSSL